MKINWNEYLSKKMAYLELVAQLPPHLQSMCPRFGQFLNPINWNHDDLGGWIVLNTTGAERWNMITSPHAATLLRAYAIKKLPKER